MVVPIGAVDAELATRLDVVTPAIEGDRVGHVCRPRVADDREVGIVAEGLESRHNKRWKAEIRSVQWRRDDAKTGEAVGSGALRKFSRLSALNPTRSSLKTRAFNAFVNPTAAFCP